MDSSRDFDGLVAIVTGAGSGIGRAVARDLHRRGAVVVAFDVSTASMPEGVQAFAVDVTDDAAIVRAIADVVGRHGGIDVLVNNAGIGAQGTVADNGDDEWRRVFDVNVLGIARVTRAALPHLRRSPSAAIVNTCSVAATVGVPDRALYSASKGAVLSLTLAMAADHISDGIRVNGVNPGTTDTPWVQRLLDAAPDPVAEREALAARQPLGRLVGPDEVAAAICHLASPRASATVGTILTVDGGMETLRLRAQAH